MMRSAVQQGRWQQAIRKSLVERSPLIQVASLHQTTSIVVPESKDHQQRQQSNTHLQQSRHQRQHVRCFSVTSSKGPNDEIKAVVEQEQHQGSHGQHAHPEPEPMLALAEVMDKDKDEVDPTDGTSMTGAGIVHNTLTETTMSAGHGGGSNKTQASLMYGDNKKLVDRMTQKRGGGRTCPKCGASATFQSRSSEGEFFCAVCSVWFAGVESEQTRSSIPTKRSGSGRSYGLHGRVRDVS